MIAQFYNVDEKKAYLNGYAFPEDSEYPEGNWVKILSRQRVSIKTLEKKAREIVAEDNFKN